MPKDYKKIFDVICENESWNLAIELNKRIKEKNFEVLGYSQGIDNKRMNEQKYYLYHKYCALIKYED